MEIKQYDIVLVNFDSAIDSEIKKTKLCLIITPDEINKHLRTVVIAPLSTKSRNYPTRFEIRHAKKTYWVALEQIRTINQQRLLKVLGMLSKQEIKDAKAILKEIYVD